MRIFIVAVMIASLTLPAYAQVGGMGGGMGGGGMGRGKGAGKGAAKATSDSNAAKKNAAEEKAFNEAGLAADRATGYRSWRLSFHAAIAGCWSRSARPRR